MTEISDRAKRKNRNPTKLYGIANSANVYNKSLFTWLVMISGLTALYTPLI